MELVIDLAKVQLVVCALSASGLALASWRPARAGRGPGVGLATAAVLAGLTYFVFGQHPVQFVKTWDVKHSYLGAKYARELGYTRLYECIAALHPDGGRAYPGVRRLRDLRNLERVPRGKLVARSDCRERLRGERLAEFRSDLQAFDALPRQPDHGLWFVDNGYNQTPFFTALLAPWVSRLAPTPGNLRALALLDLAWIAVPLLVVGRTFGARVGCLVALVFFANFANQWNLMGGSFLRFGYVGALVLAACALRARRPVAAGIAAGVATLLQVFPLLFAAGLGVWAALGARRGRRLPEWRPLAASFALTLAIGAGLGAAAAGASAWTEFVQKILAYGGILSPYRIGLKFLFLLDLPLPESRWLDHPEPLARLAAWGAAVPLAGAALFAASLFLVRRLGPLEYAIVFGTVGLYALTPIHYYYSVLALWPLVGVGRGAPTMAPERAAALLLALFAAAWATHLATGGYALANNGVMSVGLPLVGALLGVLLARERSRPATADPA